MGHCSLWYGIVSDPIGFAVTKVTTWTATKVTEEGLNLVGVEDKAVRTACLLAANEAGIACSGKIAQGVRGALNEIYEEANIDAETKRRMQPTKTKAQKLIEKNKLQAEMEPNKKIEQLRKHASQQNESPLDLLQKKAELDKIGLKSLAKTSTSTKEPGVLLQYGLAEKEFTEKASIETYEKLLFWQQAGYSSKAPASEQSFIEENAKSKVTKMIRAEVAREYAMEESKLCLSMEDGNDLQSRSSREQHRQKLRQELITALTIAQKLYAAGCRLKLRAWLDEELVKLKSFDNQFQDISGKVYDALLLSQEKIIIVLIVFLLLEEKLKQPEHEEKANDQIELLIEQAQNIYAECIADPDPGFKRALQPLYINDLETNEAAKLLQTAFHEYYQLRQEKIKMAEEKAIVPADGLVSRSILTSDLAVINYDNLTTVVGTTVQTTFVAFSNVFAEYQKTQRQVLESKNQIIQSIMQASENTFSQVAKLQEHHNKNIEAAMSQFNEIAKDFKERIEKWEASSDTAQKENAKWLDFFKEEMTSSKKLFLEKPNDSFYQKMYELASTNLNQKHTEINDSNLELGKINADNLKTCAWSLHQSQQNFNQLVTTLRLSDNALIIKAIEFQNKLVDLATQICSDHTVKKVQPPEPTRNANLLKSDLTPLKLESSKPSNEAKLLEDSNNPRRSLLEGSSKNDFFTLPDEISKEHFKIIRSAEELIKKVANYEEEEIKSGSGKLANLVKSCRGKKFVSDAEKTQIEKLSQHLKGLKEVEETFVYS